MKPFGFFISYRRQDTAPVALLLKHELERRLQNVRVAVDVEDIRTGEAFPDRIRQLIGESHVVIALMGKHWERDDGEPDWVHDELAFAQSEPLHHAYEDNYGLSKRLIIPIIVDSNKGLDKLALPQSLLFLRQIQQYTIGYATWPRDIGPLVDGIISALPLRKRMEIAEYPVPNIAKARTQPLSRETLLQNLAYDEYNGWYVDNFGDADASYLAKTFRFRSFGSAKEFMERVATHCEAIDHHPEWRNVYATVFVALTTWDARRKITIYDLSLALYMNKVAAAILKQQ